MLVELHCHSNHSDGLASVEQIMARCAAKGIGALAITDHNTFSGYRAAKRIINKTNPDLLLIPGVEITCHYGGKSGHLLALGVEQMQLKPGEGVLSVIERVRGEGGVAIAAHPFGGFMRSGFSDERVASRCDAIEALNGNTFSWQNDKAAELAERLKKPKTAGSDAHTLESIGRMACDIGAESVEGILEAIRAGRVKLPAENTSLGAVLGTRISRKAKNYLSGRLRR